MWGWAGRCDQCPLVLSNDSAQISSTYLLWCHCSYDRPLEQTRLGDLIYFQLSPMESKKWDMFGFSSIVFISRCFGLESNKFCDSFLRASLRQQAYEEYSYFLTLVWLAYGLAFALGLQFVHILNGGNPLPKLYKTVSFLLN